MRKGMAALALLATASAAIATPKQRADVTEVVEAERAFARAAKEKGVGPAFRAFVAPDGIVFEPDPVPAPAALASRPDESGGSLDWWPTYAGIAASGDLGFTTGPFVSEYQGRKGHGHYFTIWRRQKDGRWRWVLDHGPPTREPAAAGTDAPVTVLPAGKPPRRASGAGWRQVLAAESALAAALARDARSALAAVLAEDGRVMRVGPQPAVGREAWLAALAEGPATIEAAHLGGGISAAGDLAFTYGRARWEKDGSARAGHYVRIWQRRAEGWRLIVDEIIPRRPPPPPAPSAN